MKTIARWILLLLGLSLFGWFIHRAGPAEIWAHVRQLGWAAPLVLLPYLVVYLFDTWGWQLSFGQYAGTPPRFPTLFRVRWAGEAVNNVIPSGYVGGEAVKAYLLHRRGVPGLTCGTSVVASKTCQVIAQVAFIGLGALLALPVLPPDSEARHGMIIITLAAFGVVLLLLLLQRRGLFSTVQGVLKTLSLRPKMLERHAAHLRKLDEQIYRFYRTDRRRFFQTTSVFFLGWLADALEIFVVCHLLGLPLTVAEAIAIEAFISVAKAMGIFVPAALGVQESGVVLLFNIFALPIPLAVTYAILRRGRELFYVLVGGMLLYAEGAALRTTLTRAAQEASTSQ
ncbi:MAG TPA: flippase-like domain-containing protein [Verrucomicrobiota bacterium]|nr:flippase-like domain-containing protein [Verrucomicrobiota bacterium]HNT15391.1 flippase-like domain-containing protein [Verrucomicrobiota bacterium]